MRESADGLGGAYGIRGYNANQFVDRVMGVANGEIRAKVASKPWLGGMDLFCSAIMTWDVLRQQRKK